MSSEKQQAIQIFKRLYNENPQIKEILDIPPTGLLWWKKISKVLKSKLLNEQEKNFIGKKYMPEKKGGFSADVWKTILASATTSDDRVFVEKKQAKGAPQARPGQTKSWRTASTAPSTGSRRAALSASGETKGPPRKTAKKKSRKTAKKKSDTPSPFNSKKMGQFGEHFLKPKEKKKKQKYTPVELATTFCPGIKVSDNQARRLFGDDFLQILQQYNALKDKISRGGELFTEMLNCDNQNIEDLMSKLNEKPVELRIFYLLNYLEFLLNCLRQLIIKFEAGKAFNAKVEMLKEEFYRVLKSLTEQQSELDSAGSKSDKGKNTFSEVLKQNNNYDKLVRRLKINFEELIVSINDKNAKRVRPAGSEVGGSEGWTTVQRQRPTAEGETKSSTKSKKTKKVDGHDYSKISGDRELQRAQTNQTSPSPTIAAGHEKYRLEWLLKSFMNNTIDLWCEENHSKIIEYIRKLRVKNHDIDAANIAALEFLTKLMILLLQDINRVSSDRLVNNKFLLSLFARSSLCSLLADPEVFEQRGDEYQFAQDLFSSKKIQTSHIESLQKKTTKLEAVLGRRGVPEEFGNHTISKHLQEGLIFSPLDYYIAIIESQAGEPGSSPAEPTFSTHLDEFKEFIERNKSFCYGSSYTKMFSMKLDKDLNGVRGEFEFQPLWKIGVGEGLMGGLDWLGPNATVGLSRDGNLSIMKPGEQTSTGSERMKFIANILTKSLGYTSALLCLGLSDICSIAYKAATEEWGPGKSTARLQDQVNSIDVWRKIVGDKCKLIYFLLPPVPWQDPREVFNGLWSNQFNDAFGGSASIPSFLDKSEQIIDVCNKIADRTYYDEYRELWRKKQNKGGFALWCLKKNGISKLQTCRAYNLQNIHYDYNLLRNLYFSDGELLLPQPFEGIEGIGDIETALEYQYLYITDDEINEIRKLSLHKYKTGNQKKYWLLDAQAQLFKQRLAEEIEKGVEIDEAVRDYKEPAQEQIKGILDVDSNLIRKNEPSGIQRLVGDKLKTVFGTFSPLTAKQNPATGAFAKRLEEISRDLVTSGVAHDNTFKFLEQVMIIIARAAQERPHPDRDQMRLLNYERTAVVLLLDNLVGLSFFRLHDLQDAVLLQHFFNEGQENGGFEPVPWTSGRINREEQFYIGSRRFNKQFIFDYCIGGLIGKNVNNLITCCEYQNGVFVQRYVALLPTQKTQSLQSTAPTALRTGSDDWDTENLERAEMKKLQKKKGKSPADREYLKELENKYEERDDFVAAHQVYTSSQEPYSSQDENDEDDDAAADAAADAADDDAAAPATDAAAAATVSRTTTDGKKKREGETKKKDGGKRTRKRRKSKKPRKTKSKRFRKKKHKTRKKRYKKKRRKTRR